MMTQAEQARELVRRHGQNHISYLALEDDKELYFGKNVPGVVAYGRVGKTILVCGDPITAPEDFADLLAEFRAFCESCSEQCAFLGTSDVFLEQYTALGYRHVKFGEEARFHLADYQLSGGKMAKMRAQVNHANKAGLTTYEYKPLENRDSSIEARLHMVSQQWLEGKKSGELGFTLGSVSLERPMDRRYFYAADPAGDIVAFHVYTPFAGMNGYVADITRRTSNAPGGVTEKINFDAFMTFHSEGVEWGSLGISPLANVLEADAKHSMDAKFLNLLYEKGNRFYGFKSLHLAKERTAPTVWVPGYLVYSTRHITPSLAYAMVKIQNPGGVKDFLHGNL